MAITFDEERRAQIVFRFRWGVVAALGLAVSMLLFAPWSYPTVDAARVRAPVWIVGATLAATGLSTFIPILKRFPILAFGPLSIAVSVASAWGASYTGGFGSAFFWVVLLIWTFAGVIIPIRAPTFLAITIPNWPLSFGLTYALTPQPGSMIMPALVCGGAYAYCLLGVRLRDQAALRTHEMGLRLAESEERLTVANGDLERRVNEQVGEIQRRAAEVEALNAQLQQRVKERSKELSLALRRLAASDHRTSAILPGTMVAGSVEVIRPLGKGGMGAVYLGTDKTTGHLVAVKMLHRHVATPSMLQRFLHEADATASISHAGVIRILHVDVNEDGQLCLVLEYVDGISMDKRLSRGNLSPGSAAHIGGVIAEVLAAAHASGIVHRDIKPSNVLLCNTAPGVKLLDFGIAKSLTGDGHDTALTAAHEIVGTPEFISPEQVIDSSAVGPPTDVYSLALLLYFAISGSFPYEIRSAHAAFRAHVAETPKPLHMFATVPDELDVLLAECLVKEPALRPSAADVARRLDRIATTAGVLRAEKLETWTGSSDVTLASPSG